MGILFLHDNSYTTFSGASSYITRRHRHDDDLEQNASLIGSIDQVSRSTMVVCRQVTVSGSTFQHTSQEKYLSYGVDSELVMSRFYHLFSLLRWYISYVKNSSSYFEMYRKLTALSTVPNATISNRSPCNSRPFSPHCSCIYIFLIIRGENLITHPALLYLSYESTPGHGKYRLGYCLSRTCG